MNALQAKLKEIQARHGQDAFLDTKMLREELEGSFGADKDLLEAVLWCANHFVYFKAYADGDPSHMWFYRYRLLAQIEEDGLAPIKAEEALDAWIGLANHHKKGEAFRAEAADEKPLFEELNTAIRGFAAGMEPEALQKMVGIAEKLPLAHYYAGSHFLKAKQKNENEAILQFRQGAEEKNRDCIYEVGNCLRAGIGTAQAEEEALKLYMEAAGLLHPQALFLVGVLYAGGHPLAEKNPIRSLYYLAWAARQGHREARKFLAVYYKEESESGQVTNAHSFFTEETVNLGDAYYEAAQTYDRGSCFVRNWELAKKYYLKAAAHGNTQAKAVAQKRGWQSDAHAEAEGANLEATRVGKWKAQAELQSAANAGDADAQYMMGVSYMNKTGADRSPMMALSWFRRGAAGGDAECEKMIPVCNYHIGMTFVNEEEPARAAKGIPFWKRALENSEYLSENIRCDCHYQMAVACFEAGQPQCSAAEAEGYMAYPLEKNYLKAYHYMARVYEEGRGQPVDYERAFGYYLAAEKISPAQARPMLEEAYADYRQKTDAPPLSEAVRQEIEAVLNRPV